ncbi:ketosteroid isomerase-like protein [Streptomyces aurantiacus]|uniref:nuclear transport factor 2 family protein n=1 Tax=Streptomyces aurantiacus TaxID=47760 RepID=UPI00278E010A|nr:nuclear transport factor 2 family protein [Streptomyces aurantiacus]MDQ0775380.1 ketosteroid isomerase-like protein [Streptomyces aurantiacus]
MSIERNKEIAHRMVEGFSADGDINETFALLREDAVWTVMADPASVPHAGGMPKGQFVEHITNFRGSTPDGLRMVVTGVTAEGDRVAVEAESTGLLSNGNTLNQVYHFLFEIKDDKVTAVREYIDTAHAVAAFRG